MIWSDPFDSLSVGQRFRSAERTVRDTDVIVFSALTGDWHPQHCDPQWAAASPFGERIAHGLLVLACAVGLVPLDPQRVVALRRVGDAVFKRPVRLNDSIHVAGELTALRPVDEHSGLAEFAWQIRNQHDELVVRATVQLVWRRGERAPELHRGEPARGEPARGEPAGDELHGDALHGDAPADEFVPLPL